MNHLLFSQEQQEQYPVCILSTALRKEQMIEAYLTPFGISGEDVIGLSLHLSQTQKKTPVAEMKLYIEQEVVPTLHDCKVQYLVCTDAEYFKVLTKQAKVEANLGYVLDCVFGPWKVVYVPSFRAIFYDPEKVKSKIKAGMDALLQHAQGTYKPPGESIMTFFAYPWTEAEIATWLDKLLEMNVPLSIDIEAFDLKHYASGIGTISFAWSKSEGIAFCVDYHPIYGAKEAPFGINQPNLGIRKLLLNFFMKLQQTALYHNIAFDVYVLIYQLFMDHLNDTEGLLDGLDVMLKNWHCTKLITYLATNSCAGNKLSLKDQAQAWAGNYAIEEIKDITKIPVEKLLQYNLIDAMSTWYVYEKHWNTLVADEQLEIYETLFKPATVDIIQMQLTGLPVNMERVTQVEAEMLADEDKALTAIRGLPLVQKFEYLLNEDWVKWKNSTLKKKRVSMADAKEVFNPNSPPQLQRLLYEELALPVIATTDSKLPATDGDTLVALQNHTADPEVLSLLANLRDYKAVNKILTSFIPALKKAQKGIDEWHYLFGNFNLGGTLSGRLSSNSPNLQNLPASNSKTPMNKKISKLIKSCFAAPKGKIFAGLDFASLEDRISALTTKDPNKLKVYSGHLVYELEVDGVIHHIRDDATIVYDGKTYTGEQFYELHSTGVL